MSTEGTKVTLADAAVFTVCELIAIPLCHAGWEAIVTEQHLGRGIVALVAGLPLGILGVGFHWWKDKISAPTRKQIQRQIIRWWPVAAVLAFVYVAGPELYRRAIIQEAPTPTIGPIAWNFEQLARGGGGYFLNMIKTGSQEIRVLGFQAHGKNYSTEPISEFSGYMRLDLTNVQLPIYILAQDVDESKIAVCTPRIPTAPQETFGIPGFADFDIGTYEKPFIEVSKDGVLVSKFLNDFVPFTVVLTYQGATATRQFTREEVTKQIDTFEKSVSLQSIPRVIRKSGAKPWHLPPLRPLVQPQATPVPALPPLKLLIPPSPETATGDQIHPKD
jgi:hypothetical protein